MDNDNRINLLVTGRDLLQMIKELKPLLWFLAVAATMIGGLYCAAYLIQVSAAAGLL